MVVKKLVVSNFKSFDKLEVDLGQFNALIGANASGKSNFVEIFKFLRDISQDGLDNAVSMQGGVEYLRNIGIGPSRDLSIQVVCKTDDERGRVIGKRIVWLKANELEYEFALSFGPEGDEFRVSKDKLIMKCELSETLGTNEPTPANKKKIGEAVIVFSVFEGKAKVESDIPRESGLKIEDIFPRFMTDRKYSQKAPP